MNIEISVVFYVDGNHWVAQGLEFDITAQALSLPEVSKRFVTKVAAEVAISLDLKREPLAGIEPAPQEFWRMWEGATMSVTIEPAPMRISDGAVTPRILPRMRVAEQPLAA